MNASDQTAHAEHAHKRRLLDAQLEAAWFAFMQTKGGRTAVAWMVRGTHNLSDPYVPGSFDQTAYNAGRQYDARSFIAFMRKTKRCSDLFDQALREYEDEYVQRQ